MKNNKLFNMSFEIIYTNYLNKVNKKGRSEKDLLDVISWFTGYDEKEIEKSLIKNESLEKFLIQSPQITKEKDKILGTICGVKIQEIKDPLMKKIRQLDKVINELSRGRDIQKIKRY